MLEGFIDVTAVLRAGVYMLVREGAVVYVGQATKATIARIEAHRSNWGRKSVPDWMPASLRGVLFDRVYVMPCRIEDLDRIERGLIDLYKPKHNIKHKAPTPTTTPITMITPTGITVHINHRAPAPRIERRF